MYQTVSFVQCNVNISEIYFNKNLGWVLINTQASPNFFNNFGRDPPQEYAWILGRKSGGFFQRCRLKLLLPYGSILAKTKNWQNFKFHNSLNNFGRELPHVYAGFFWSESRVLSEMLFEDFSHIWSHVNENGKNCKKSKMRILKTKMVWPACPEQASVLACLPRAGRPAYLPSPSGSACLPACPEWASQPACQLTWHIPNGNLRCGGIWRVISLEICEIWGQVRYGWKGEIWLDTFLMGI